jgi:hypothetical protein
MKAYEGIDVQIHIFLTSPLLGGEWSASHPCCFTLWGKSPGTHWIGSWVGPRAGLDGKVKRKFLTIPGLEIRELSVVQPAATRCADSTIPARYITML